MARKNIRCQNCPTWVTPDDDYYATPCGTFCDLCMDRHAKECEICANEFGLHQYEKVKLTIQLTRDTEELEVSEFERVLDVLIGYTSDDTSLEELDRCWKRVLAKFQALEKED